jgi:hypothetical protein
MFMHARLLAATADDGKRRGVRIAPPVAEAGIIARIVEIGKGENVPCEMEMEVTRPRGAAAPRKGWYFSTPCVPYGFGYRPEMTGRGGETAGERWSAAEMDARA